MGEPRGIPLLSGPPPLPDEPEPCCRKCSREFGLFTRGRRCNHCGYLYCSSCTDYQALMPRTGLETGYDVMHVCAYCIENLNITASGKSKLKSLNLGKLRKYINAYGLKATGIVEKNDLVDLIVYTRERNGCLPSAYENYYRSHSVPKGTTTRSRHGLFSRSTGDAQPPSPTSRTSSSNRNGGGTPQRPPERYNPQSSSFSRPDLDANNPPPGFQFRDSPNQGQRAPRPQTYHQASGQQPHSYPQYQPRYDPPPGSPPRASRPPRPATAHPTSISNARPSASPPPPPPPNRPRSASANPRAPEGPAPTLSQLLEMTRAGISSLSVHALKGILFQNHVQVGLVLEKADLVEKVVRMVEQERADRERDAVLRAMEEEEERLRREEVLREKEREKDKSTSQSNAQGSGAGIERTGLCVICQDEEASIAVVDCGHLAMCRGCSELVMSSTKECPLCRTRIVTEARLLRIYKT